MAEPTSKTSLLAAFRKRREEIARLRRLYARSQEIADGARQAVKSRVVADLDRRAGELESAERRELRELVDRLKQRKEEIGAMERDLEEIPFRTEIGELDAVEGELRRESVELSVRDARRDLDRELDDYRAVRALTEAATGEALSEARPEAPPAEPVPPPSQENAEPTAMFDGFALKRAAAALPPPPPPPSPVARPSAPEPAPPVAASRASQPPPSLPPVAPPPPPPPPTPPVARTAPMKPEPEEVGMESLVVNMDFNPRSAMSQAAGLSPEEVDDLAELDELSKSLDDLTEEPAVGERGNVLGLKPIPMPAPVADEMSESSVADRMPSSSPPLLTDAAFEDSTFVKTSGSSGRIPPPPPPRAAPPEPPRADGAMPHLVLKGEAGTRRAKYPLKKGVSTVGRGLDNEVVLDDRAVSRKHATIGYELDGSFRITDLGSENGTYVNGTRITSQILREGDEIHLGKTTLIFTIPH